MHLLAPAFVKNFDISEELCVLADRCNGSEAGLPVFVSKGTFVRTPSETPFGRQHFWLSLCDLEETSFPPDRGRHTLSPALAFGSANKQRTSEAASQKRRVLLGELRFPRASSSIANFPRGNHVLFVPRAPSTHSSQVCAGRKDASRSLPSCIEGAEAQRYLDRNMSLEFFPPWLPNPQGAALWSFD